MYFDSLAAAWDMTGHGPFVWSAYALTFSVLTYLIVAPLRRFRAGIRFVRADINRNLQGAAKGSPAQSGEHSAAVGVNSHAP